jgi:transcriptional regulator with XRE-family HTH domain
LDEKVLMSLELGRVMPTAHTLRNLVTVLGVSADELLDLPHAGGLNGTHTLGVEPSEELLKVHAVLLQWPRERIQALLMVIEGRPP